MGMQVTDPIPDARPASRERPTAAGSVENALPQPHKTPAWGLTFLPLATAMGYGLAALLGFALEAVSLATLAGAAALVILDKRALAATGKLPRAAAPSTAWFLFPPGYLFRRAKRLGTSRAQAWIAVACLVLAFAARVAIVAALASYAIEADAVLPGCADRSAMADILGTFDEVPAVQAAGIHGVVLVAQREVGQGPGAKPTKRYCTGRVRASNTQEYDVQYDFELEQGQVIIRVELP